MFSPIVRKQTAKPGYLREDVAELTKRLRIPTIISGRIIKPDLADQLIKDNVTRLIGLGRVLRSDSEWVFKAAEAKPKIKTCVNCNWCLKRVVLDEGFNCRRWLKHIQEKTDLEIKLLSRNYKGLFVATNSEDLKILQTALPHILPDKENIKTAISPTFLILKSHEEDNNFDHKIRDFFEKTRRILDHSGFTDALLHKIVREAVASYDQEVHLQAQRGNHGLIIVPRNIDESWRSKVAIKERGKVVVHIGTNAHWTEVLVPVDMSINTLLTLMFLKQTFMKRDGFNPHFVHVLSGPARSIEQRWLKIKKIAEINENIPLRLIDTKGDVAEDLLHLIEKERFDAIIMGRRGISRLKRWLLGSVSAGLLRGVTDETFFLID